METNPETERHNSSEAEAKILENILRSTPRRKIARECGVAEHLDDIDQDFSIVILNMMRSGKAESEIFSLRFTIFRNKAIDYGRKERVRSCSELPEEPADGKSNNTPVEHAENNERQCIINKVLNEIPIELKPVIIEEETIADNARRRNLSHSAVRYQLTKIHSHLAKQLENFWVWLLALVGLGRTGEAANASSHVPRRTFGAFPSAVVLTSVLGITAMMVFATSVCERPLASPSTASEFPIASMPNSDSGLATIANSTADSTSPTLSNSTSSAAEATAQSAKTESLTNSERREPQYDPLTVRIDGPTQVFAPSQRLDFTAVASGGSGKLNYCWSLVIAGSFLDEYLEKRGSAACLFGNSEPNVWFYPDEFGLFVLHCVVIDQITEEEIQLRHDVIFLDFNENVEIIGNPKQPFFAGYKCHIPLNFPAYLAVDIIKAPRLSGTVLFCSDHSGVEFLPNEPGEYGFMITAYRGFHSQLDRPAIIQTRVVVVDVGIAAEPLSAVIGRKNGTWTAIEIFHNTKYVSLNQGVTTIYAASRGGVAPYKYNWRAIAVPEGDDQRHHFSIQMPTTGFSWGRAPGVYVIEVEIEDAAGSRATAITKIVVE